MVRDVSEIDCEGHFVPCFPGSFRGGDPNWITSWFLARGKPPPLAQAIIDIVLGLLRSLNGLSQAAEPDAGRPNIRWPSSEDHGPEMGCYGDKLARTPHVDPLAAHGNVGDVRC